MSETFMKERPILPLLASMALPMVLSMLVNSLYNIVDSFFVAQISEAAMTALSLVYPVQNFINAVAIGFGVGINAVISIALGAGDRRRADAAATHGMALSALHGLILTLANPKYFLPVHGEYKHLKKHAATAASLGIPEENIYIAELGDCITLTQDGIKLGEPVVAGSVMVDGLGVGDVGNVVLRDRRHLSQDGLVIIVATVDSRTGQILAGPDIVSRGFVYVREAEKLIDDARDQVRQVLEKCRAENVRDWNSVKTRVREAASAFMYRRTKRSPMILPILMEV